MFRLQLHRHHVSITLHCSRYESSPSSIKPSTTNPISPQPPSFSRDRSVGNWTHRGHSLQQCVHTAFIEAPEPAWETALSFWRSQWNPQRRYDHLRPLYRPRKGRYRRDTHIRSGMHPGSFSHAPTAISPEPYQLNSITRYTDASALPNRSPSRAKRLSAVSTPRTSLPPRPPSSTRAL